MSCGIPSGITYQENTRDQIHGIICTIEKRKRKKEKKKKERTQRGNKKKKERKTTENKEKRSKHALRAQAESRLLLVFNAGAWNKTCEWK